MSVFFTVFCGGSLKSKSGLPASYSSVFQAGYSQVLGENHQGTGASDYGLSDNYGGGLTDSWLAKRLS